MKRVMLFAVVGVVVLGLSMMAVYALEEKPASQTKTGTVKKVDVEGKKIVVMVLRELTFAVTADTKIVQGDQAKTLADIKVGDKVTVEYSLASPDNRVASKITIQK